VEEGKPRSYCLDSFGERGGKWEVGIFPCSHDTKEVWELGNHSIRDGYDGRCLSDAPSQLLTLKTDDINVNQIQTNVNAKDGEESAQQGGAACTSIDDCFLGGECKDGLCVCDVWRTAANCSQISLLPVAAPGHVQVYPEAGWSIVGCAGCVCAWQVSHVLFAFQQALRTQLVVVQFGIDPCGV
jgi:hypothetical protein